ncbi:MAG: hypothetical protein UW11_C0025G0009 [Parcubacteria group bacterium GW2011_GWA2_43_9b]|nr:MAG: hypothetical protein UW11_C0025G0009 [Parcubacteria group bacterium GW2011_GWA2_43_9b]
MAKKSVIVHCRFEVVDFDEKAEKRAGQEALKNRGICPSIPEVPGLDLNEGRIYYIYEGALRFRRDERLSFADWFSTEAVKAVIDSRRKGGQGAEEHHEEDIIPYGILIRKEIK